MDYRDCIRGIVRNDVAMNTYTLAGLEVQEHTWAEVAAALTAAGADNRIGVGQDNMLDLHDIGLVKKPAPATAAIAGAYQIIETDNFGGDYPDEKLVSLPPFTSWATAMSVANAINKIFCSHETSPRYWRVVAHGYKLQPGFTA